MKRKIKFRGKDSDGIIHYGGYYEDISGIPTIIDEYGDTFKALPNSVAQLIGCDKNGNEIYEGDEIRSHFGNTCYASFRHYALIQDSAYTLNKTRICS